MAVIKCKMCGGDLILVEGASTAECEFCGSIQTIPKVDDEKKLTLFARANRLRFACEFDKAAGIYESIVADFPEEVEAYWGLVLCKYGIEYVDDPATGKKIPTCHRSSFDSVMESSDFEQALENADSTARRVYREEAKQLEEIRKGIIAVSASEEPYDIFICYKETAENGDRTLDSVLAQDVYDALTDKGYRVFFSRITLEDKLGMEYEPYIFAALNSAKIMLAFGTDYEYYNAVWVKNEWSRFLNLMSKDKSKHLIPCYKGIDAYDMPKEFAKLQAQDLGKVGATQDLLRGIEKILPKQKSTKVTQVNVVTSGSGGNPKIASLLDRGNMALEDGDWAKADSFLEEVLNNDSKNAQAYLSKTLAQEHCSTLDAFISKRREATKAVHGTLLEIPKNHQYISVQSKHYIVPGFVNRDAIGALYEFDRSYLSYVSERKEQYQEEEKYWNNHKLLSRAEKFATGAVANTLQAAKQALFDTLTERIKAAEADEISAKQQAEENYAHFLKQADQKAEKLNQDGLAKRENCYQELCKIAETSLNIQELRKAYDQLNRMGEYKDSKILAAQCLAACEKAYALFAERRQVSKQVSTRIAVSPNIEYPLHVGIKLNGKLQLSGTDKYRNGMRQWNDITAVSLGEFHALGLNRYGEAVATGDNQYGQCDVSQWKNIVAIVAGGWHSVALLENGTVCATGINEEHECDTKSWRGITKIAAGRRHTVGLKADGTVVATGLNANGRCNVSHWTNIVDIFAFNGQTIGLRADGTVLSAGTKYRLDHWKDIVDISMGYENALGLKKDGTVVYAGENKSGENAVSNWTDIVAISAKNCHCVGLRADGTVVAAGLNESNQCAVGNWSDIVAISAGDFCTLGIRSGGTVMRTGDCMRQPYDTFGWKLFNNINSFSRDLKEIHQQALIQSERQMNGVCQHCGGEFKGLFSKKCVSCGKPKDY